MQRTVSLAILFAFCVGCTSRVNPGLGSVRFDDGTPVRSGSVEFRAKDGGQRYASRINENGDFALTDTEGQKGIKPGDYQCIVVQIVLTEDLPIDQHRHGNTVPRRYADYNTSDLTYNLDADDLSKINLTVAME